MKKLLALLLATSILLAGCGTTPEKEEAPPAEAPQVEEIVPVEPVEEDLNPIKTFDTTVDAFLNDLNSSLETFDIQFSPFEEGEFLEGHVLKTGSSAIISEHTSNVGFTFAIDPETNKMASFMLFLVPDKNDTEDSAYDYIFSCNAIIQTFDPSLDIEESMDVFASVSNGVPADNTPRETVSNGVAYSFRTSNTLGSSFSGSPTDEPDTENVVAKEKTENEGLSVNEFIKRYNAVSEFPLPSPISYAEDSQVVFNLSEGVRLGLFLNDDLTINGTTLQSSTYTSDSHELVSDSCTAALCAIADIDDDSAYRLFSAAYSAAIARPGKLTPSNSTYVNIAIMVTPAFDERFNKEALHVSVFEITPR